MESSPQPPLRGLSKGQVFEGFLLVKGAEIRPSANGSKYLDMTVADASGEVNAKLWDAAVPAPPPGSIVKVRGMMLEFKDRPQLRVDKLRPVEDGDEIDRAALVRVAPEEPEAMLREIEVRVAAIADGELRLVVEARLSESRGPLMYYPAAQRLHHAERSGLLHHMIGMLRVARALCEVYPSLDGDLLAAGVVLHDLCKISELSSNELGVVEEYTREGMLLGHLAVGAHKLLSACERLGVRGELADVLAHMILSHHDLPEFGSPRRPMFPEAEALHVLDRLDARMYEMFNALEGAPAGGYTEKIWSLERKLYRRESDGRDDGSRADGADPRS